MDRLNDLPTAKLWEIFQELAKIPHASGNESHIAGWILKFAKKNHIEGQLDKAGNVILRKKASKGFEHAPAVCMQGHMDMVAVRGENSRHDFSKDPLKLKIVEIKDIPYVTADNTTLGADDCIGVAAALTIMTDPDLEHGPLEALFTVGEETSMVGMNAFEANQLKCRYMLNLDSENDEEVTVGCAGGEDARFEFPLNYQSYDRYSAVTLSLAGLTGGHSGIEIHKKRANAIQTLALILREIGNHYNISLQKISGGTFRNAIPNEVSAVIGCAGSDCGDLIKLCKELENGVKEQYAKTDPNLILLAEAESVSSFRGISHDDTMNIIETLCEMPDGIIRMSDEFSDTVETSCNLGLIRTLEDKITTESLMRSFIDTRPVCNILDSIAEKHHVSVAFSNKYPGWTPDKNSSLLKTYCRIYEDFNFKKPAVCVIHAGVECGLMLNKYPDIDVISFGPTITGAHTVDEKVSVYSVEKFYGLLIELIGELAV